MVVPTQFGSVHGKTSGYVLLGLLLLLAVEGLALMQASIRWNDAVRLERERELLKIGDLYRKAIGSYYNQTPGIVKQYPPNLEALLSDNRFPVAKRHIRKLYVDPVTLRDGWGIVQAPSGGVMGVYSLSDKKPFKQKNFRPIYQSFEDKKYYGEWYFIYLPSTSS